MAKLWAARFGKETDSTVNDFNSSISFDSRLYKEDITGSMAHAAMLGKQGIIENGETEKIIEGLKGILSDLESGTLQFSEEYEDVHMNIEQILTERIGDAGKRLHTARSRNDQVALDLRLYVKKEILAIKALVLEFMEALCASAEENLETVMPGYTHAWLHPFTESPAGDLRPLYDGLCQYDEAGRGPSGKLPGGDGRYAPGIRRTGIHDLSH